jgi:transposase
MDRQELKRYERFKEEAQFLRSKCQHLRRELDTCRPAWYRASKRIEDLEQQVKKLKAENRVLKQRVKELTPAAAGAGSSDESPPAMQIKPSIKHRRSKRPGRKAGHPAALRPMPDHIDAHQPVPLPKDSDGCESCPTCNTRLGEFEEHERVVEDIIPSKVAVKCYHTRSGYCPHCHKRVESRALEQPPAANIPHGQLGLNTLATAMVLRIVYRLPFRQISAVFADLPGLSVSSGAIARQVQRVAEWFDQDYEKLLLQMRCAPIVHADETGWRVEGKNGQLWTVTSPDKTLYHVDKSRGGKVIKGLLGEAFGGTLVSDFYSAYSKMDCKKQKCLAHLLRELKESAEKSPAFAATEFYPDCKKLIRRMLHLKKQWDTLSDDQYLPRLSRLESELDQLAKAQYDEPNARRIGKRLRKHQTELTAFLWTKDLQPTNNAAERALRPAVVARKISGGSRSRNGAQAWAKLASLMRTATQQNRKLLDTIRSMLAAAWATQRPPAMTEGHMKQ